MVNPNRAADLREGRYRTRLARLIEEGRDHATMLATEHPNDGRPISENPPYVQFAWRDDLRLQIETQGDHYRDAPYSDLQHRLLRTLDYDPPFKHGDDFCNWIIFRDGEGCEPLSVANLLISTLVLVHGVHFHDRPTSLRHGVSYWTFQVWVSPSKRNIKAEIEHRFRCV